MSRATIKLLRYLADLHDPKERFLPLRLEMQTAGGRQLLSGGGIWDRRQSCWRTPRELTVLEEPELATADLELIGPAHVLIIEDSQIEYVLAFGAWLKAYLMDLPRPASVDVLAGKRRGGKTWVMVACVLLAGVAVPSRTHPDGYRVSYVGWLCVPSFPEQREMHEDIRAVLERRRDKESREMLRALRAIPERWWQYRPHPNNCYLFVHGAAIYLKSANRPDSLKQGRVDVIGLNEGQKCDSEAAVHCAGNTIDAGGLLIMAVNAPRRARGQYLRELKFAVEEGRAVNPDTGERVVRWFTVDPERNTRINQSARSNFRIFANIINPRLGRADADAEWNELLDVAFFNWKPSSVLKEIPADWVNVTGEVIATMRLRDYIRSPAIYSSFGGVDFNKWPWFAFVGFKAFRIPSRGGVLVYVADREFRNEHDRDRPMHERQVIMELYKAGWRPDEICWIADPSGQWQNSETRQRGGVTAGHSSFDLFRSETVAQADGREITIPAWDMFAPTTWKLRDSKHYAHPRVTENLDECNELFAEDRLFMLEHCTHLIYACKRAPLDPHERGCPEDLKKLWHVVDAFRYPLHRAQAAMDPKKKPRNGGGRARAAGGRAPASGKPLGGSRRGA